MKLTKSMLRPIHGKGKAKARKARREKQEEQARIERNRVHLIYPDYERTTPFSQFIMDHLSSMARRFGAVEHTYKGIFEQLDASETREI